MCPSRSRPALGSRRPDDVRPRHRTRIRQLLSNPPHQTLARQVYGSHAEARSGRIYMNQCKLANPEREPYWWVIPSSSVRMEAELVRNRAKNETDSPTATNRCAHD